MITKYVLLPGLDGTSILFEPLLEHLERAASLVSYPQSLPAGYPDVIGLVRESLPRDEEYVLLGWSFSGPLALMAAAEQPPGLRGVVLCASFVTRPTFYLPRAARFLARPILFSSFARLCALKALLGGYSTPEVQSLLRRAVTQAPAAVLAERARATLTVDVRQELLDCPVPVHYLGATRDFLVPRTNARRIRRLRPDVSASYVPGPHTALMTNPAYAAVELESFCRTLDQR